MKNMKTFEGFRDWFKDSDEDVVAKDILKRIDDADPEDIERSRPENSRKFTYSIRLGKNSLRVEREDYFLPHGRGGSWYHLFINDVELQCSYKLKEKISDKLLKIYNEEKRRQDLQKITTDLG